MIPAAASQSVAYRRGNDPHAHDGPCRFDGIRLRLEGGTDKPASAEWHLRAGWKHWVICVRLSGAVKAGTWTLTLDDLKFPLHDLKPIAEEPSLWALSIEVDLAADEPHSVAITHYGPEPLVVHDVMARPRSLSDTPLLDALKLEEGRYWGAWLAAHRREGDESIVDGQCRGTHPSFLTAGVRVPDLRDARTRYGFYPDRLSNFLLDPIAAHAGEVGLDLGTGCGQFALQAARQGVRMIGVDVGPELLQIARNVALQRAAAEGVHIDYVRAEADRLPFRPGAFGVVTVKEALHHLEAPERAVVEAHRVLRAGGQFVAAEHVLTSPLIETIFRRVGEWMRPLIVRRHPVGPVPPELMYPSPMEDVGCNKVLPALREAFPRHRLIRQRIIVEYLDVHVHYAFGRWRKPAGVILRSLARALEATIDLLSGQPLSIGFIGQEERPPGAPDDHDRVSARTPLWSILACPMDGTHPLRLHAWRTEDEHVEEGALVCPECGRWFAILEGIPHLVRDGLRLVDEERALLARHRERLPHDASNWQPYGVDTEL